MPRQRNATADRELLRAWNAGAPIDGRERDPPLEQRSIDDCGMDEYDASGEWEESAFDEDDCGWMGPQLGCSAAGTEECDWDCPINAAMRQRRRRKKKGEG